MFAKNGQEVKRSVTWLDVSWNFLVIMVGIFINWASWKPREKWIIFYTISYFMEEQKINRMLSTRSPRPSSQTYYHFSYPWVVISAKCRGGCVIFYFFKFLRLRACVSFHKKSAMDKYFYLRLGDAEAWKGGRSSIISRLSSFPFDIVWSISNPNLEFRLNWNKKNNRGWSYLFCLDLQTFNCFIHFESQSNYGSHWRTAEVSLLILHQTILSVFLLLEKWNFYLLPTVLCSMSIYCDGWPPNNIKAQL